MTTSAEVRARIIDMLRRDLIGPLPPTADGDPDADLQRERLGEPPSGWYLTGFIGPMEALRQDGAADDPDADEERETDGRRYASTTRPSRARTTTRVRWPRTTPRPKHRWSSAAYVPASIGITVVLPDSVGAIDVRVTWGDYTTEPPLSLGADRRGGRGGAAEARVAAPAARGGREPAGARAGGA